MAKVIVHYNNGSTYTLNDSRVMVCYWDKGFALLCTGMDAPSDILKLSRVSWLEERDNILGRASAHYPPSNRNSKGMSVRFDVMSARHRVRKGKEFSKVKYEGCWVR